MPTEVISNRIITQKILIIRGQKVMIDRDLAQLYGVTTGYLNKAVKRNIDRFPKDFMFQITKEEYESLRFQFGILKRGAHAKYLPHVFTEQGVAMLSSVLNSKNAVQVNITIMRVFVRLREAIDAHKELSRKMAELEKKFGRHDKEIQAIFEVIKSLVSKPVEKKEENRLSQLAVAYETISLPNGHRSCRILLL